MCALSRCSYRSGSVGAAALFRGRRSGPTAAHNGAVGHISGFVGMHRWNAYVPRPRKRLMQSPAPCVKPHGGSIGGDEPCQRLGAREQAIQRAALQDIGPSCRRDAAHSRGSEEHPRPKSLENEVGALPRGAQPPCSGAWGLGGSARRLSATGQGAPTSFARPSKVHGGHGSRVEAERFCFRVCFIESELDKALVPIRASVHTNSRYHSYRTSYE